LPITITCSMLLADSTSKLSRLRMNMKAVQLRESKLTLNPKFKQYPQKMSKSMVCSWPRTLIVVIRN